MGQRTEIAKFLILQKANVEATNQVKSMSLFGVDSCIAAHFTECFAHVGVISRNVKHTISFFVASQDGATPLHLAAGKGYAEIARLLIHHHANVDKINRKVIRCICATSCILIFSLIRMDSRR